MSYQLSLLLPFWRLQGQSLRRLPTQRGVPPRDLVLWPGLRLRLSLQLRLRLLPQMKLLRVQTLHVVGLLAIRKLLWMERCSLLQMLGHLRWQRLLLRPLARLRLLGCVRRPRLRRLRRLRHLQLRPGARLQLRERFRLNPGQARLPDWRPGRRLVRYRRGF